MSTKCYICMLCNLREKYVSKKFWEMASLRIFWIINQFENTFKICLKFLVFCYFHPIHGFNQLLNHIFNLHYLFYEYVSTTGKVTFLHSIRHKNIFKLIYDSKCMQRCHFPKFFANAFFSQVAYICSIMW